MSMTPEAILSVLEATARQRFGSDRAAELRATLEALAGDLARVAATSLPPAVEPDFTGETEPTA
ncbi:MAG: hypothetical protein ACREMB_16840 [Candidatus Rokuibacteriota bacterium]